MKFKIKLKRGECSTESNISAYRVNVECSQENKFELLKASAISKFQNFGITKDDFNIYWEDSDGDFINIADEDDLSLALEEMSGPIYELIACLKAMDNEGMFSRTFYFSINYSLCQDLFFWLEYLPIDCIF